MSDFFIIEGGRPLQGEVRPAGNKNAALPMLAACLLTDQPVTLHNVPRIGDVGILLELLKHLGVRVLANGGSSITVQADQVTSQNLSPELCQKVRASILLAGPLLGRSGQVELPPPGGDVIGRRRIDTHLLAFEHLGAQVEVDPGNHLIRIHSHDPRGLHPADILLDEASVTATENALMAAAAIRGRTVIRNAASEPHVQNLCQMLCGMGAQIDGIGSNCLTIQGDGHLHGGEFTIWPDLIEVGSFLGLGAVTPGELRIKGVNPSDLRMVLHVFQQRLGVNCWLEEDDLVVGEQQELRVAADVGGAVPKIDDGPWPHFPADLLSVALVAATQAQGTVLIHEKMFESRLFFVDKLITMGARIILCDPHRAVVVGPSRLYGQSLSSPDIRAGMALVMAALAAEGVSTIANVNQIDRGYERLEEKLLALGAAIERRKAAGPVSG
ncbi:MAG: UDP-N-acetylglucosamine 1-carboxyvinyltransferase [Caldilineales bacterium]|nr:UDP-N-acetylglucosamine 1-carboxyvinyltransferase [Caldilineales bacterium]MCW5858436.1 UDP-N-acetylglucosamine 1-carboxyvinyltransferase [Caldilineales bacterium]